MVVVVFVFTRANQTSSTQPNSSTASASSGQTAAEKAQQAKVDAQNKQNYLDNASKTNTSSSPTADSTTTTQPQTSSSLTTLTASEGNGSVTILTQMQNVNSGTCTLKVTNGTKSNTQTAEVIYQPQFSSCAGFTVPVGSLGTGNWSIQLTVQTDSGSTLSKTISTEVN